jgi:hypothetical protein
MATIKFSLDVTAIKARAKNLLEEDTFSIMPTPVGSLPGEVLSNIKDIGIKTSSGAGANNSFKLNRNQGTLASPVGVFSSSNTEKAVVNSLGQVTYVSSGLVTITYTSLTTKYAIQKEMVNNVTENVTYTGWASGSLAKHMDDSTRNLLSGETANQTSQSIFSTLASDFSSATENSNLFCRFAPDGTTKLNFSCVTITRNGVDYNYPAVLISPRHVLVSDHVQGSAGEVKFQKDGVIYTTNQILKRVLNLPVDQYPRGSDNAIWYIDPPITGVEPAKVLPSNWRNFLPSMDWNESAPKILSLVVTANTGQAGYDNVIFNNFTPHVRVFRLGKLGSTPALGRGFRGQSANSNPEPAVSPWMTFLYAGDSSSPVFTVLSNQLCLIGTMQSGGGGTGHYYISDHITEVEALMAEVTAAANPSDVTVRTLTKFSAGDLSAFTQY